MGFAEIQAAFAANVGAAGGQVTPVQPTPAPAAFAPTTFTAPQGTAAPAFPTPSFAPAAAPVGQTAFAFTPPAGFVPSSAPPINPPGERAALTVNEPRPGSAAEASVQSEIPADPDPAPAKAKRGRKPKAAEAEATPPIQGVTLDELGAIHAAGQAAVGAPSIEGLVQALFSSGVSSVHLTFSKPDA